MTSADGNILKNGNIRHVGRENTRNKRGMELDRIGEANCLALYELQLEIAMNAPDMDLRCQAQQYLLNKVLPNAKSKKVYIELKPMENLKDIADNENAVLQYICNGDITLEDGEKLFGIIEQCRKTKETVEIGEEIQEVKQFIADHKNKK